MICYDWNEEKNQRLIAERGIGFEEIVEAIATDGLLDTLDHPNQRDYPNQKMYVVRTLSYVYVVPFVRDENKIFLKTIIPSRKAKKHYGDDYV